MDDDDDGDGLAYARSPFTTNVGPWLLIGTTAFCFIFLILSLTILAVGARPLKAPLCDGGVNADTEEEEEDGEDKGEKISEFQHVLQYDRETKALLKLVGPYTMTIASGQFFDLIILVMVAHMDAANNNGGKHVAAYAMVGILLELSDAVLMGPIHATATLGSHAVGADNYLLSGQYTQLAVVCYLMFNIPVMAFWYWKTYGTLTLLGWADHETASLAQEFVRSVFSAVVFYGLTEAILQLWNIEEYAIQATLVRIVEGVTKIAALAVFLNWPVDLQYITLEPSLELMGWVITGSTLITLIATLLLSDSRCKGYLDPFQEGLFGRSALSNTSALKSVLKTAVPIMAGSFQDHAEWTLLTCLASLIGPAEVATWAILGALWELFYSVSEGVGEAAEMRISLHLGNNNPVLAQHAVHKSLVLVLIVSISISILTFSLADDIPTWFTPDPTLQQLLKEVVPFVGVGNVTMAFGMICWYVLGAQQKYALATLTLALCSWGICLPLAVSFTLVCDFDLRGLASAVACGYVVAGACLSYFTMVTDWDAVALKISNENAEEDESSSSSSSSEEVGKEESVPGKESTPLLS